MADEQVVESKREYSKEEVICRKTLACGISLGVAIMNELVGEDLKDSPEASTVELVTAAVVSELKL